MSLDCAKLFCNSSLTFWVARDPTGTIHRKYGPPVPCCMAFLLLTGCILTWSSEGAAWNMLSHLRAMLPSKEQKLANTFNYETSSIRSYGNQSKPEKSTPEDFSLPSVPAAVPRISKHANDGHFLTHSKSQPAETYSNLGESSVQRTFAQPELGLFVDTDDVSKIPGCSDVPLPFGPSLASIYVEQPFALWRKDRESDMLFFGLEDASRYCGAISRLVRDGFKCSYFGIDFSDVVKKRGLGWTMDDDIKAALVMYYGRQYDTEFKVVQVDYEMRYRFRDMNMFVYGPRDKFSDFFRDGFLRIADLGVDIAQLREEVRVAKRAESWEVLMETDAPWFINTHLKSLDPLMHNKQILEVISFYMGSDVVVNGYQYWHVHANSTTKQHRQTAEWHHDSCGTRVKLFVYLHDVDEDRLVTEIATGSQTVHKFTFGGVHPWFKTSAVGETWKIAKMTGPPGGGFIFDPNTIHRAKADAPHLARDAVIVDISSTVKADLGMPSKERPCPLHTWRTEAVNSRFEFPEKEYGPVTSDLLNRNNGTGSFYEEYYRHIRSQMSDETYKDLLEQSAVHGTIKKSKNRTLVALRAAAHNGTGVTRANAKKKVGLNNKEGDDKKKGELSHFAECANLPMPFGKELVQVLGNRGDFNYFIQRHADAVLYGINNRTKYCGAVSRLIMDGLKWNHFGMDFSDVVHKRGLSWNMDEDIIAAIAMYWGRRWSVDYLVVLVDYELRYRPRHMNKFVYGPQQRFSDFFRDGYVKITDLGVDIGQLKEEIRVAKGADTWESLHQSDQSGTQWFKNMRFKALEPLINNNAILELLAFYVGSDVMINGYQYWHVNANLTRKGNEDIWDWHHDGCGTRAKIFLYIHDINENGLTTEIAAGSQTSLKYTYSNVWTTGSPRPWFQEERVHKAWRVDTITGPAGGGFIFDPNALHRAAAYKGHLARDVVVIDVSSAFKAEVGIPSAPFQSPCPSVAWRTESVNKRFEYPEKGYGRISSDLVKKGNGQKSYEEYYKQAAAEQRRKEQNKRLRDGAMTTTTTTTTTAKKVKKVKTRSANPCAGRGKSCTVYGR